MNIRDKIAYADALLESQEREALTRRAEFAAKSQVELEARNAFLTHCRQATPKDYADWLVGYFRDGGRITHPRPSPLPGTWYVFCPSGKTVALPPLYGALAVTLIVPSGVKASELVEQSGSHNRLLTMDGFKTSDPRVVELFTDVREALLEMAE